MWIQFLLSKHLLSSKAILEEVKDQDVPGVFAAKVVCRHVWHKYSPNDHEALRWPCSTGQLTRLNCFSLIHNPTFRFDLELNRGTLFTLCVCVCVCQGCP